MITNVSIASVFVTDQDKAKAFYVDKLGFVEQADITIDNGFRWCAVCHPDHPELMLSLAIPGPPADPELVEAINRSLATTLGCFPASHWPGRISPMKMTTAS